MCSPAAGIIIWGVAANISMYRNTLNQNEIIKCEMNIYECIFSREQISLSAIFHA